MPKKTNMLTYEAKVEVHAEPGRVFPHVADPEKRQAWMNSAFGDRYVKMRTEWPDGFDESHAVGTKFIDVVEKTYAKGQGRFHGEILQYEKPSVFAFRSEVPYRVTYNPAKESAVRTETEVTFLLEPTGDGGTLLTWKMADQGGQDLGILNGPLSWLLQKYMKRALNVMKRTIEK